MAVTAGRAEAMLSLRLDAAAAQVMEALAAQGVSPILLKGATFARWLYADGSRRYLDVDVLVAPRDRETAETVLVSLGFRFNELDLVGGRQRHADEWLRGDGVAVDLHRTIQGCSAPPEQVFAVLGSRAEPFTMGGTTSRQLDEAGRCLHVAVHASQSGAQREKKLEDLRRALACSSPAVWREAADLARELRAEGAMSAGLALLPRGQELSRGLDLDTSLEPEGRLRARAAPQEVLAVAQIAGVGGGVPGAFAAAWHRSFPPAAFMRRWAPFDTATTWRLALAYPYRWLWLAGRLVRAVSWWIRTRSGPS